MSVLNTSNATPPAASAPGLPSAPRPDEVKTRKVEMVLQQLDTLPTLPAIAMRLMTLTGTSESKIEEVVQLLSADQSLTGKLLSLASSAMLGARAPITTVQQAVVRLGFDTVRNLVLSVKVFEAFQQRPVEPGADAGGGGEATQGGFNRAEFWKHSLAVATAAELLSSRCKPKLNVHDAFVCGLLHDIGKVAFDTAMPKSFSRVVEAAILTRGDLADVERRIIGMDHALAGKRLAEAWNLPQLITQAIWLHGAPPLPSASNFGAAGAGSKGTGLANMSMVLVVGLADLLVRRQHIGFSGNFLFPYETSQYAQHLGLTDQDIDDVTEQLTDALEKRAQAIGLYDLESRQLYLESIANANAELGRVNQTLAMQNRKLAMRSTCFEIMTRFYQRIVPAASPAQLLREIGHVAHQFLDSNRLVLFSQDPDQTENGNAGAGSTGGVGEVLLFDPTQPAQDSFLMTMPMYANDHRVARTGSPHPNQNFTRPARPQLDWLLERVQNFLGTSQCWFMPLLCGSEPVGGVLWIAKENTNAMTGVSDLALVSQAWGMTLRTAQIREQQTVLTESLAAANRELGALQDQLIRAKSLASLGEMAAGAAHEMNNPLAVVCGRAQLLAAKIHDGAMKQEASLIAQQGERLSQIITDMMEFAKPAAPRPAPLAMETVVQEAVKSATERAGGVIGGGPKVKVEIAPGLPTLRADAKQIRNALAEIVLNAIQASHKHEAPAAEGRTSTPHAAEVMVQARFDPLDSQMIVQVIDHGVGMSEDVMRQAFSPFFSAKAAGRNRGMGLAKALRWVENHGGTIRLDSTLGAGTTVVLILPVNSTPDAKPIAAH
ncbi:MAG TPA: HDOD domain-containing protein [Phycisphaerae bacterium]|nr:HDOD domain-containing protein [Phycisphaerae bacterium]